MSKRLVFENDFAELWFHPEACIVHHRFRKFIWGEAYQRIMNEGLDLLVREGACKWLSENREDTVHSRADSEWVVSHWLPRSVKAGFRYWAIVPPDNVLGQMNMDRLVSLTTPHGVTARLFKEDAAALTWLASIEVASSIR